MAIELTSPTTNRTPVLRRRVIGESFVGALVNFEARQQIKRGDDGQERPVVKSNGKPRMELVVTMVALPGCTMNAGLGEEEAPPEAGDVVRTILKGGGYGAWIDADKALLPRYVGDIVVLTSDHAQLYSAQGTPEGQPITDQDAVMQAKMRGKTVGIYGSLTIRRATPSEAQWVQAAEAAYHEAQQAKATVLSSDVDDDDEYA